MNEPTTSQELSLKLKAAGASQAIPQYGCYWDRAMDGAWRLHWALTNRHLAPGEHCARAFAVDELISGLRDLGWFLHVGWEMGDGDRVDGEYDGGKVFASASIWRMVEDGGTDDQPMFRKDELIGFSAETLEEATGQAYLYALWKENPPTAAVA